MKFAVSEVIITSSIMFKTYFPRRVAFQQDNFWLHYWSYITLPVPVKYFAEVHLSIRNMRRMVEYFYIGLQMRTNRTFVYNNLCQSYLYWS